MTPGPRAVAGMAPLPILDGVLLSAAPAVTMLLGTLVAIFCVAEEARVLLAVAQHFSAGILVAAISTELVSKMVQADSGPSGTLAIGVGFFGGFALLTLVKTCVPEDDEDEGKEAGADAENPAQRADAEGADAENPAEGVNEAAPRARTQRSERSQPGSVGTSRLDRAATSLSRRLTATSPIPYGFAIPVYVDCVMDGFLLGVIAAASLQAGMVMSAATCLEMGFLGFTFGAILKPCGWKRWPMALLGPCLLLLTGAVTALGAGAIAHRPDLLQGLLAFGASSLLFLVTEELLEEARKNDGGRCTSFWFFVGFFAVILSERVL